MVIASTSSLALGASQGQLYHLEGSCCSTSYGIPIARLKSAENSRGLGFSHARGKHSDYGRNPSRWLRLSRDCFLWRASVAADYSDSLPDASNYTSFHGYHPLEDVKPRKRIRNAQLTSAELARTTVEANSTALLILPGSAHCEPHDQISWAEFPYVVDDFGDIFFSIPDDKNIFQDPGAANLVNALVGMDIPSYGNKRIPGQYEMFSVDESEDFAFDEEYYEAVDADIPGDLNTPDHSSFIHPIYFAKSLSKAIGAEHNKKMDHPSNGVSFVGCLRPAFADEELYVKDLLGSESDGYDSDWKDGETTNSRARSIEFSDNATLYRLDMMKIELFSAYGSQIVISLQDFQDAEPDVLAKSTHEIVEQFVDDIALKSLCKKKGLYVEAATLIGVDSLGIDVRVSAGVEVRTYRFPFKSRAANEVAAGKQIQQLLFPRARRKKLANGGKEGKPF